MYLCSIGKAMRVILDKSRHMSLFVIYIYTKCKKQIKQESIHIRSVRARVFVGQTNFIGTMRNCFFNLITFVENCLFYLFVLYFVCVSLCARVFVYVHLCVRTEKHFIIECIDNDKYQLTFIIRSLYFSLLLVF